MLLIKQLLFNFHPHFKKEICKSPPPKYSHEFPPSVIHMCQYQEKQAQVLSYQLQNLWIHFFFFFFFLISILRFWKSFLSSYTHRHTTGFSLILSLSLTFFPSLLVDGPRLYTLSQDLNARARNPQKKVHNFYALCTFCGRKREKTRQRGRPLRFRFC